MMVQIHTKHLKYNKIVGIVGTYKISIILTKLIQKEDKRYKYLL